MASPQIENGYSRLANEILEALIKCPPATVPARQFWDWVWRESWGRKGAATTRPTSVRDLARELGFSNGAAGRAIETLLETNHVIRNRDGSFSIQKDHELWVRDTRLARRPPASKQLLFLDDSTVPRVGTKCPTGGDKTSPRVGQNRPTGGDKTVPTRGTLHIRYLKKERKKESIALRATPVFSSPENDTPRTRAEAGDPQRPPEEHHNFSRLGFRRRDELTDLWKERVAQNACRRRCGRLKASETWPFCRPCTACATCGSVADGERKFRLVADRIICAQCETQGSAA